MSEDQNQEENSPKMTEKKVTRRDFIAKSGKVVAGAFAASMGMKYFAGSAMADSTSSLTLLATTDEHQYIVPYDYMSDSSRDNIGLSKVFTLVEEERAERENTMLLSAGDTIQGSLVGNYEFAVNPLEEGETQTIVKVFNHMGYEAAAVGNHELQDYGMPFFEKAVAGAEFSWLSSNIKEVETGDHYVEPYTIVEQELDGETVKVGIFGVTPPQTMLWGSDHVRGILDFEEIVDAAEEIMPELREEADIVIALAHTGIDDSPKDSADARENAAIYLSQVDGIDAMILGHNHRHLPGDFEGVEMVNNELGLINGIPAIMAGSWGDALGAIDLELGKQNGVWRIAEASVRLREIDETVASHAEIEELASDVHDNTVEYVRTPIGTAGIGIASFFSRVADSPVTQIVNDAQLWWAEKEFAEGEYSDLPILSAAAPFQAGREDAEYFTNVQEGDITIGDVTDIYIYDNEIRVMKVTGAEVIEWLERSAENFNQIDPDSTEVQDLLDGGFSAYNYDVIDGVDYEIDVTQPKGQRITNVMFDGEPIDEDQEFLVVTNDYRAGGGGGFGPAERMDPVYAPSGLVNREIIIEYIEELGTVTPTPTDNWRIKPVEVAGPVHFRSHPEAYEDIVPGLEGKIEFLELDENGMGVFELDIASL